MPNLDADALQACASAVECIIKDGSIGLGSVEIIAVQLSMDFVKDFFQPYLRQRLLDASMTENVAIDGVARGYVNRADIQKLAKILQLNFVDDMCQPLLRRTLMAIGVPSESAMTVSNSLE